jgi:hypothetical protein
MGRSYVNKKSSGDRLHPACHNILTTGPVIMIQFISRLLKNTHLLRCANLSSLRRTVEYASFLVISRALHLNVFDQPVEYSFLTTCKKYFQ